jgi:hypothetical protein
MADPVSWLLIESGWSVVGSDGEEIGTVTRVDADEQKDIFSGIELKTGLLGGAHYVPAERVARIEEGRIELDTPSTGLDAHASSPDA